LSVCRSDVSSEDDADDTGIRGRATRDDLLLFTNDFVVNVRPDDEHGASRYEHEGLLLYVVLVVVENRGVLGHVYEDANSIFFFSLFCAASFNDKGSNDDTFASATSTLFSLTLFPARARVSVRVRVCV
jgi:hypothetical protein